MLLARFLPLLVLLPTLYASENLCFFVRLPIDPIGPNRKDVYAGSGREIRIEFQNESTREPVTAFPEPPLTIIGIQSHKTCSINEGGIWARDSVFLSNNERTLLVLEYSGEDNHLIAYNTQSCREIGRIDVTGASWRIKGNRLLIGTHCDSRDISTCRERHFVRLQRFCVRPSTGVHHER